MCRLSVLTDRDKKSCDVFCDRCSVFLRSKSQKTEEEIGTLLVFTNFPYYGFNSYTRILRFFFFSFFVLHLQKQVFKWWIKILLIQEQIVVELYAFKVFPRKSSFEPWEILKTLTKSWMLLAELFYIFYFWHLLGQN